MILYYLSVLIERVGKVLTTYAKLYVCVLSINC